MITLQEMMNGTPAKDELLQRNTSTKIRVAIPGIIKELIHRSKLLQFSQQ